jgi:hypothetical protein
MLNGGPVVSVTVSWTSVLEDGLVATSTCEAEVNMLQCVSD